MEILAVENTLSLKYLRGACGDLREYHVRRSGRQLRLISF